MVYVQAVVVLSDGFHVRIDFRVKRDSQDWNCIEVRKDDAMKPAGNDQVGPGKALEKCVGALFVGTGKGLNRLGARRDGGEHSLKIADGRHIGAVRREEQNAVAFLNEPPHHFRQLAEVCGIPPCILLRPSARIAVRDRAHSDHKPIVRWSGRELSLNDRVRVAKS
jgi:hypothetical protein